MADMRKITRAILAIVPAIALCGIGGYSLWALYNADTPEVAQSMKEVVILSLGIIGSTASGAVAYYFKKEKDEE